MSWCDKLASTPAAGFSLDPNFVPGSSLMEAFGPIFNAAMNGDKPLFQVDALDAFNLTYTLNEGIQISIEPMKVAAKFIHRLRAKTIAGGPPIVEMQSKPEPYTKLLPTVIEKAAEATLLIPSRAGRQVTRVGIVTQTSVDEDSIPPGIKRVLEYLGKPWGPQPSGYTYNFTVDLHENAKIKDRCIYTLTHAEGDELLTMLFDWQRTFKTGRALHRDVLRDIGKEAEKGALEYFEELAEGNQFDANLNSTP